MTKAELLARLAECDASEDTEGAHWEADEALLKFIGDDEIAQAYGKIHKWYA